MAPSRRALLIPAEEQSREMDAKLLLACVAVAETPPDDGLGLVCIE
jgi:hypothetical protein